MTCPICGGALEQLFLPYDAIAGFVKSRIWLCPRCPYPSSRWIEVLGRPARLSDQSEFVRSMIELWQST